MSGRLIVLIGLTLLVLAPAARGQAHRHQVPHPATRDRTRFCTSREVPPLPLPAEEDAFFFVIFGDRTGGPSEGVEVLAEAVRETNLLQPDLVMTVGDLIEGYNEPAQWMKQMREFKGIMSGLLCPWYPVAGNHDIYWRGPNRPPQEHEDNYERHLGPLWYAFEHKDCWFIALYSDEGNPLTGERAIDKPGSHIMSGEQLSWLQDALHRAAGATHVFVFIHHPRWLGRGYGDDWERVHPLLAAAGNVRAVFAGHIHRMRYDGPRDGIEYVTLATTGGVQEGHAPGAGYLHHYHIITVRPHQIGMTSVPVGTVMDVRAITGEISDECRDVARSHPEVDAPVAVRSDGAVDGVVTVTVRNPASRPIEVTLVPQHGWACSPDHDHERVPPHTSAQFTFQVARPAIGFDETFRPLQIVRKADYLAGGFRYAVRELTVDVPLDVDLPLPPEPASNLAIDLDGAGECLRVPARHVQLPDGPLTLECWFRARTFGARTGLLAKTESSEYGLFVSKGVPSFSVFLGKGYVTAKAPSALLRAGVWHHVAGVFDGDQVRLYVDGRRVAVAQGRGPRRLNEFPLTVGADVDHSGAPVSHFDGTIDAVRLSSVARYGDDNELVPRRPAHDADTWLLLNMDAVVGPWVPDASGRRAHAWRVGEPRLVKGP